MGNAFHGRSSIPGVWASMHEGKSGNVHPVINVLDPAGRVTKLFPTVGKHITDNFEQFCQLLHDQQLLTNADYNEQSRSKDKPLLMLVLEAIRTKTEPEPVPPADLDVEEDVINVGTPQPQGGLRSTGKEKHSKKTHPTHRKPVRRGRHK